MTEYVYKREIICDGVYSIERTGEQIVRCRDCRFYEETGNCNWFECSSCWTLAEVEPDGFCAWGERRGV